MQNPKKKSRKKTDEAVNLSFAERRPWIVIRNGRTAYYLATPESLALAAPVYKATGRRYRSVVDAICEAKDLNDKHEALARQREPSRA